jgi:hypothetical protein
MGKHPYGDVAAEVVRIIDWESLDVPRGHGAAPAFRGLAKRLWFDSTPDLSNLYSAFTRLCVYGFIDRAEAAALVLRGVPNPTPMVQLGYIAPCVTSACCFAERAGDLAAAEPLRELALNWPGTPWRPLPLGLDGSRLNHLFQQPDANLDWRIGEAFKDVARLSDMWVYGSPNPDWTKDRIGATIDANIVGIHSVKKWQPWQ